MGSLDPEVEGMFDAGIGKAEWDASVSIGPSDFWRSELWPSLLMGCE